MMRFILFLSFLFVGNFAFAQVYVNNVNINDRNIEYLEVWDLFDEDSNKFAALVDYGQEDDRENDKKGKLLRVTSAKGTPLQFNGLVHILNYMHQNGWEVMDMKNMGNYESYLMKRKTNYSLMPISGSDH